MVERALYSYWQNHPEAQRAPAVAGKPGRPLSVGTAARREAMVDGVKVNWKPLIADSLLFSLSPKFPFLEKRNYRCRTERLGQGAARGLCTQVINK